VGLGKIAVSIPTLTGRLLAYCVRSVFQQREVEPEVLIVRNGEQAEPACLFAEDSWPCNVVVHRPPENMGVAASWNHACRWAWGEHYDAIAFLNDDVQLTCPETLKEFVDAAAENPRRLIGVSMGEHGFSAFCWTRWMWDALGPFDEGFWPAYFEDYDMLRRMDILGIPSFRVKSSCRHEVSDTIRNGDMRTKWLHSVAFPMNERRYFLKWGGRRGAETYPIPWNGGVPLESTKKMALG
jgi:GT2 family glycosyltransferase